MVNVKIFCVTKNEYDLIEHFIIYYGYLFGYNNLIIIDNNSTDELVLKIYDKYINLGIKVVYESNYQGNGQADMFNKYMFLEKSNCDFLVGLDTDEFLFSYDDFKKGNDPFCKEKILQIFNSYCVNNTSFKISSYPCSVVDKCNSNYINNKFTTPATEIVYFSNDIPISENMMQFWSNVPKYFVRSNAFIKTSCGNHSITTSHGNSIDSSLGLLHFNNTGRRRYYERAKSVIDGYMYFSTSQDISKQIDMLVLNKSKYDSGHHKINSYHILLLRMFILELFITYIKRLPSQKELEGHSYNNLFVKSGDLENSFKNCEEAILNRDTTFIFNDEIEKNNIIFYDESLDELSSKYKIFKNTCLQELFLKIHV
jgi:hypothetical protein